MKILISTFSEGDAEKIQRAMRLLPYERLVLVGRAGEESSADFKTISRLEEMAGERTVLEPVTTDDFLGMVDRLCEVIGGLKQHDLCVNISGGDKLLGDAALFAAFRMGVPARYVDGKAVRLPVIVGASAKTLLTRHQEIVLRGLERCSSLDTIMASEGFESRHFIERIIRTLTRMELVVPELRSGTAHFHLTQQGQDILKWIPEDDDGRESDVDEEEDRERV